MSEVPEKFLEVTISNGDLSVNFMTRRDGSVSSAYATKADAMELNLRRKKPLAWRQCVNALYVEVTGKDIERLWKEFHPYLSSEDAKALQAFRDDKADKKLTMADVTFADTSFTVAGFQPVTADDIGHVRFARHGRFSADGGDIIIEGNFNTVDWDGASKLRISAVPGDAAKFLRVAYAALPGYLLDWAESEAYDRGHFAGEEEVVSILNDMLGELFRAKQRSKS